MQPGGHLDGECHLACSDPMKSGTEPHEPVAPHTVPSVWPVPQEQRLISTGGLALCGTTCPPPLGKVNVLGLNKFPLGA